MIAEAVASPEATLGFDGPGQERAARLRALALQALRSSGYSILGKLRCEVVEGVLVLSGVVPSFHLKQLAQTLVLKLRGIKRVENLVAVARA
jgi:hypothetical protein